MAVEYKIDIDSGITERGIYYADLKVFYQNISITKKIVFSRYMKEKSFNDFWKEHKLSEFEIKEKSTSKQIVHQKVTIIKYLGDVNIHTYNSWKTEQESTK